MDCSVAQCLEVVGEWWSMLIVRDAFLGVTRFDGIAHESLEEARLVLAERGRRALRIHLGKDVQAGLGKLTQLFQQSLQ